VGDLNVFVLGRGGGPHKNKKKKTVSRGLRDLEFWFGCFLELVFGVLRVSKPGSGGGTGGREEDLASLVFRIKGF